MFYNENQEGMHSFSVENMACSNLLCYQLLLQGDSLNVKGPFESVSGAFEPFRWPLHKKQRARAAVMISLRSNMTTLINSMHIFHWSRHSFPVGNKWKSPLLSKTCNKSILLLSIHDLTLRSNCASPRWGSHVEFETLLETQDKLTLLFPRQRLTFKVELCKLAL